MLTYTDLECLIGGLSLAAFIWLEVRRYLSLEARKKRLEEELASIKDMRVRQIKKALEVRDPRRRS